MAEHAPLRVLGERLRALRAQHGITRQQLSEASGVSMRYLASVESGRGNMSVLLLYRVARAMGVGVHRLLHDDERAVSSAPRETVQAPSLPENR